MSVFNIQILRNVEVKLKSVVLFKKYVLTYILLTFHKAFLFNVEKLHLSLFCIFSDAKLTLYD